MPEREAVPTRPAPAATAGDGDPFTLREVRAAFEEAGLSTTVTGLGSAVDAEIAQPELAAVRVAIPPTSREFELYVFPDEAAARRSLDAFAGTDLVEQGGAVARGANVVAAFPEPPRAFRGYRVVERVLAGLDRAGAAG